MNPVPTVCWIGEYPRGCVGDECIRGENYAKLRLYGVLLPILLCMITITVSMMMLYLHVRKLENTVHSYSNRWTRNLSGRKSERVFRQALLYICAFLCVWVPFIVQNIIVKIYFGDAVIMFYTLLFCNILFPLQGLWNALIYARLNPIREVALRIRSTFITLRNSIQNKQSTRQTHNNPKEMVLENPSDVLED